MGGGMVRVKVNRARDSPIHQIGANECDGHPQGSQLLRIGISKLEAESGQGGGNVDQSSNQRNNTTHLCPVVSRIVRAAEKPPQTRGSKHAEPDDFLFTWVIWRTAFGVTNQQTLDRRQPFRDGQHNIVAWIHTSKRQLYCRSKQSSYRYRQSEPERIFDISFGGDMPFPYGNADSDHQGEC